MICSSGRSSIGQVVDRAGRRQRSQLGRAGLRLQGWLLSNTFLLERVERLHDSQGEILDGPEACRSSDCCIGYQCPEALDAFRRIFSGLRVGETERDMVLVLYEH